MGIFTVKCANPECLSLQKRADVKCSECGTVLPYINRRCWRCLRTVGTQSKFCSHCGCDLSKSVCEPVLGNLLQRKESVIAIKITGVDISDKFMKTISIEPGSTAYIVTESGNYFDLESIKNSIEEIEEIYNNIKNINEIFKKIIITNKFSQNSKATIYLLANHQFLVPTTFYGIRIDNKKIEISMELVLFIHNTEALISQLLFKESVVTVGDIEDDIKTDVETGLKLFARKFSLKELFGNPMCINEILVSVREATSNFLKMNGLALATVKNICAVDGEGNRVIPRRLDFEEKIQVMLNANEIAKLKTGGFDERIFEFWFREKIKTIIPGTVVPYNIYYRLINLFRFARKKEDFVNLIKIAFICDDYKQEMELIRNEINLAGIRWYPRFGLSKKTDIELEAESVANSETLIAWSDDPEAKRIRINNELP